MAVDPIENTNTSSEKRPKIIDGSDGKTVRTFEKSESGLWYLDGTALSEEESAKVDKWHNRVTAASKLHDALLSARECGLTRKDAYKLIVDEIGPKPDPETTEERVIDPIATIGR